MSKGLFYFQPVFFKKEPGAAAPRTAEDLFAAPGLNLRRKRGLGFAIPLGDKKEATGFWLKHLPFFIRIFFLHFVSTLASEGIYLN